MITDFVMSCRVASKAVEQAVFEWLRRAFLEKGMSGLSLAFAPTIRNRLILDVLREVGFQGQEKSGGFLLSLSLDPPIARAQIVEVCTEGPSG